MPFTLQGQLPERPRLRRAGRRAARAERRAGADRLPGQGLRQLPAGAVGVLRAALPRLGGAVGGRRRRRADGGARGDGRRAQLLPGPGRRRRRRSRPRPSGCRSSATPGSSTTSRRRRPSRRRVLQLDVAIAARRDQLDDRHAAAAASALGADGSVVDFEVGRTRPTGHRPSPVSLHRRRPLEPRAHLVPYWWDDSQRCLPGRLDQLLPRRHGFGLHAGQQLLLDSPAADSADPPVRELVDGPDRRPRRRIPCFGVALTQVHLAARPPSRTTTCPRTVSRGQPRPGRPGPAPDRDLRDPGPGACPRPGRPWSALGAELDAAGPAARLPLLPGVRPAGLARHASPGPGHRGPGAARDRAASGPRPTAATPPWTFAALAARRRPGRPGVHADPRAVLARAHQPTA